VSCSLELAPVLVAACVLLLIAFSAEIIWQIFIVCHVACSHNKALGYRSIFAIPYFFAKLGRITDTAANLKKVEIREHLDLVILIVILLPYSAASVIFLLVRQVTPLAIVNTVFSFFQTVFMILMRYCQKFKRDLMESYNTFPEEEGGSTVGYFVN